MIGATEGLNHPDDLIVMEAQIEIWTLGEEIVSLEIVIWAPMRGVEAGWDMMAVKALHSHRAISTDLIGRGTHFSHHSHHPARSIWIMGD